MQRCAQLRVTAAATLEAATADADEDDIIVKPPLNLKGRSRSRRFRDMAGKVPGRTVELGRFQQRALAAACLPPSPSRAPPRPHTSDIAV